MVLAELVLCESRGPVSFIKHLLSLDFFNTPRDGYRGLFQRRLELEAVAALLLQRSDEKAYHASLGTRRIHRWDL